MVVGVVVGVGGWVGLVVGVPGVGANVVEATGVVVLQPDAAAASGRRETPSATVGSARHERSVMSVPQAT